MRLRRTRSAETRITDKSCWSIDAGASKSTLRPAVARPSAIKTSLATMHDQLLEAEQAARRCEWSRVRGLVARIRIQALQEPFNLPPPDAYEWSQLEKLEVASARHWWADVRGGGIALRRARRSDADFYKSCYQDADFVRQFNRQPPWRGDLGTALDALSQRSPISSSGLLWVVHRIQEPKRVGLVTLSGVDWSNRKAQLAIGSTGTMSAFDTAKAMMLAIHFAFFVAGLNKLYTYVYDDNPRSLEQTLGLGFRLEGRLVDHVRDKSGAFVSIAATGLTRQQLAECHTLHRIAKRMIGVDWGSSGNRPPRCDPQPSGCVDSKRDHAG